LRCSIRIFGYSKPISEKNTEMSFCLFITKSVAQRAVIPAGCYHIILGFALPPFVHQPDASLRRDQGMNFDVTLFALRGKVDGPLIGFEIEMGCDGRYR
jgi:hypothetical protein